LFRKDPGALAEWSEANVMHCAQRQQRIIADVWPALKPGGLFIYATCSYSPAEDEAIADWICQEMGGISRDVPVQESWGITPVRTAGTGAWAYRFFPHLLQGEGFFMAAFSKGEEEDDSTGPLAKPAPLVNQKTLITQMAPWIKDAGLLTWYQRENTLYAMPEKLYTLFSAVQKKLRIRKAGVNAGDWMGRELVPAPDLAFTGLMSGEIPEAEVTLEEALAFLRKENIALTAQTKGWHLIRYQGVALGWVKNIGNRVNNYYPKEWRLRS
jgi:NOL1/NOP2/fmu family ribosome biogenesis protein